MLCKLPLYSHGAVLHHHPVTQFSRLVLLLSLLPHRMLSRCASIGAAGVLMARRDFAYVARAYMFTLGSLWLFMGATTSGSGWSLHGVWAGLVLFFALRCCQSIGRLLWMGLDTGRHPQSMPAA